MRKTDRYSRKIRNQVNYAQTMHSQIKIPRKLTDQNCSFTNMLKLCTRALFFVWMLPINDICMAEKQVHIRRYYVYHHIYLNDTPTNDPQRSLHTQPNNIIAVISCTNIMISLFLSFFTFEPLWLSLPGNTDLQFDIVLGNTLNSKNENNVFLHKHLIQLLLYLAENRIINHSKSSTNNVIHQHHTSSIFQ